MQIDGIIHKINASICVVQVSSSHPARLAISFRLIVIVIIFNVVFFAFGRLAVAPLRICLMIARGRRGKRDQEGNNEQAGE